MSSARKTAINIPESELYKYRTNALAKKQRLKIENKSHGEQVSVISSYKGYESLPVVMQVLLEINHRLQVEDNHQPHNARRLNHTLDAVAKAINFIGEVDRVQRMWLPAKHMYLLHLKKDVSLLDDLVANTQRLAITENTNVLWAELATWLGGMSSHIAKNANDMDDKILRSLIGVSKMQLALYQKGIAQNIRHNLVTDLTVFTELDAAIQESLLLAPKNKHGMFAGRPSEPFREMQSIMTAMQNKEYNETEALQAIIKLAVKIGGAHHPVAVAAKECLHYINNSMYMVSHPTVNLRR